ncbi:MAG: Mur ligase [Planctomycetes bacterium]|nr:Mur ligase [Planctomycetota bacterium]
MEFLSSRRLTGPNLLWDQQGIVVDVAFGKFANGELMGPSAAGAEAAIDAWQEQARRVLAALGWDGEKLIWRVHPSGLSLAFSAPIDALYAGIDVGEWIWNSTTEVLAGREPSNLQSDDFTKLRLAIAEEQNPMLAPLHDAARQRGLNFCGDDEWTTIGMGRRSQTWDTPKLPTVGEVAWDRLHDIPSVMVTGTNGKSTTVRALFEMVKAAGLVPGASSTDWIQVGEDTLDKDDWSGPGGARAVLKDPRVDVAILETARGGMLRRGLGLPRVDVAVITNVAEDHLGEMGVHDLPALTEVKFIVERAGDSLVLNADNPEVRRRGQLCTKPVLWYTLNADDPLIQTHLAAGGDAIVLQGTSVVHHCGANIPTEDESATFIADVAEIPMTLNGAVRYNIGNAMAAVGAAMKMALPLAAIQQGLQNFSSDSESNPGRLNVFDLNGITAMVDFAHNPHGMQALIDAASAMPHKRLLVLLGQAGDRDDHAIQELVRITAAAKPDRIVVKELTKYLRGREKGAVSGLIQSSLIKHGYPEAQIEYVEHEIDAVRHALKWAKQGDLLLLISHSQRESVLKLLTQLQDSSWSEGKKF